LSVYRSVSPVYRTGFAGLENRYCCGKVNPGSAHRAWRERLSGFFVRFFFRFTAIRFFAPHAHVSPKLPRSWDEEVRAYRQFSPSHPSPATRRRSTCRVAGRHTVARLAGRRTAAGRGGQVGPTRAHAGRAGRRCRCREELAHDRGASVVTAELSSTSLGDDRVHRRE
jgi:hypothetical protein